MMRAPRMFIAAAVLACALPAAAQNETTEPFTRTAHLDANGTFDLTNIAGNIVVTGGTGRDVTIEAVKRVQRPNPNVARTLLQMIDIQVAEQSNRVEVRTVYPRPRNFPGSVDFMITVPRDAYVTVRATTGSIHATNVRVDAVRIISGDIEINDASTDEFATASTVSGNIAVRGLKGRSTQLNTVSGNVRVEDSQLDRLMAKAVSGNIDYTGDLARNGRYEFVSHSGDVRLMLAGSTGFEVQANSFTGTVRSDFDVNRRARGEGAPRTGVTPRGIRGTFGDASAMLVVRAFSGNIVIARRSVQPVN